MLYDEWFNKLKTSNVSASTTDDTPIDLQKCATRNLGCQSLEREGSAGRLEDALNAPHQERSYDFLDQLTKPHCIRPAILQPPGRIYQEIPWR